MKKKLFLFSTILIILFGFFNFVLKDDDMKPEDFKNTEPVLQIEKYFEGNVKAWGVLQDRSGKVTRQFTANMSGKFENNILTLNEEFFWKDGEKQKRIWKIEKIDDHNYIGTAPDVVGEAKGFSYGSAFKFEYDLMIPIKGKNIKINFDDWIFKQDDKVAINRATLKKFGFKVGELTVFFQKI
tara:strand:- start:749 stop:1297 length:549 start_codon:yes stop_codon:yes gene_type:complete